MESINIKRIKNGFIVKKSGNIFVFNTIEALCEWLKSPEGI